MLGARDQECKHHPIDRTKSMVSIIAAFGGEQMVSIAGAKHHRISLITHQVGRSIAYTKHSAVASRMMASVAVSFM